MGLIGLIKKLNLIDIHVAIHDGIDRESRHTLHAQFLGDVLTMSDHGGEGDVQPVGYLLTSSLFSPSNSGY